MSAPRPSNHSFSAPHTQIALIAVFTALSLATNYAMIDLPNVKLMDALIFMSSFLFGLRVGLGSAIFTWTIYGFVNPYGQDDLTLLLFLIAGECFYAIAGTLLKRLSAVSDVLSNDRPIGRISLVFGLVGFQATFAYDILTNFGSWVFKTNSLYQAFLIGTVTGVPFAVIHELSNIIFFATVVPLAIVAARRVGMPVR